MFTLFPLPQTRKIKHSNKESSVFGSENVEETGHFWSSSDKEREKGNKRKGREKAYDTLEREEDRNKEEETNFFFLYMIVK